MANRNGAKYGFTGLFPILPEQSSELRTFLRSLDDTQAYPRGSPFSAVPVVHMTRLFIVDRLAYQGTPAKADTLRSGYLVFACDFDGDNIDALANALISHIPRELTAIWGRCLAFPGIDSRDALSAYFERCQIDTNLFLADQPLASVADILKALMYRRRLAEFVRLIQRKPRSPAVLKRGFSRMMRRLAGETPLPGSL